MKRFALPLVVSLAAAACSSSGSGARQSEVEPAAAAAANADWEPMAKATSPCERYTLRLEHAGWRGEPGGRPQLSLQFALRTGEADVLLAGEARVTDLVTSDGTEFRFGDLHGGARAYTNLQTLAFHGLEVYHRDDRLRRLRVETRIVRVFSWTTHDVSCAGPDAERADFVCAPYTVSLSGDPTLPSVCRVGACIREGWREFPPSRRDLIGLLGHDWVARSAILADVHGRPLQAGGGAGSGGFSSWMYSLDVVGSPVPDAQPEAIAWPVRGTIRLPDRYVVEVVPFEFTDVPLVPYYTSSGG